MPSFVLHGTAGCLKSGSRVVTELRGWRAEAVEVGRLRVAVTAHTPDPYWWEHYNPDRLKLDLALGRRGLRGPATLISTEPLVLEFDHESEA